MLVVLADQNVNNAVIALRAVLRRHLSRRVLDCWLQATGLLGEKLIEILETMRAKLFRNYNHLTAHLIPYYIVIIHLVLIRMCQWFEELCNCTFV